MALASLRSAVSAKLGARGRYTDNLLGESLELLLKKATSKHLQAPDEETNQQASGPGRGLEGLSGRGFRSVMRYAPQHRSGRVP